MESVTHDRGSGLQLRGLTLSIDGRQILCGIDVDVPAGRVTGFAGESGSGKTLTGMTIMGLQPENAIVRGSIRLGDRELLSLSPEKMNTLRGRELAMVFQDPTASLHPMLSIGRQLTDHLRFHLKLSKKAAVARAMELLTRVRVPEPARALKRYPHQFSGGQLQRIAIAIAIACEPTVLVADEPTTALDVTVQAGILALLRELCDSLGLTIILISHDFGVMSSLADSIVVLRDGVVVEHGSRYDVIRNPQHPYTKELIDSLPLHVSVGDVTPISADSEMGATRDR